MKLRVRPRWYALATFAALCVLAFSAYHVVRDAQRDHVRSVVDTFTRVFITKFEERLQSRFQLAEFIGDGMIVAGDDQDSHFVSAAEKVHSQFDDLQALNWVGVNGLIEIVTPIEGNEAALGLNVMSLAAPSKTLRAAAKLDRLQVTPPITLAQGGRGFVAYLPVRTGKDISGYINVVFRADPFVESVMGTRAQESFLVSIHDGETPIRVQQLTAASEQFSTHNRIAVGGREWTVTISPTHSKVMNSQSYLDEGVLVVGMILAFGMALLISESANSREALRDREERFSLAMQGASDGLFDWSPLTGKVYYSPRWFEMLGYKSGELVSEFETFTSLVHPDDLTQVLENQNSLSGLVGDSLEKEFRMLHKDGSWRTVLSRAFVVRKSGQVTRVVGTHVDITGLRDRQKELERVAITDDLTGLQNRRGLYASLEMQVTSLGLGEDLAIFHLDLDRFKSINDTLGHEAGDFALQETSQRLQASSTGFDLVARVGGDEFLLTKVIHKDQPNLVRGIVTDLIQCVSSPFYFNGRQCSVGASVGISSVAANRPWELAQEITNADIALHEAKDQGRGSYMLFEPRMREIAVSAAELTAEIEIALEKGEFSAYFQPQINVQTGRVVGFEALARWQHPKRGLISAGEFVPCAEQSHLIEKIDNKILYKSCEALRVLASHGFEDVSVSTNLSTARLSDPNFVELLNKVILETQTDPRRLSIELLESTLLSERTANVVENVHSLAKAGFRLELDDFGTGHTAIASLLEFPVSRIKIDRSLVTNIASDRRLQTIAEAIMNLGSTLGIDVLAEGVETPEDLDFLRSKTCHFAQGYYVGAPIEMNEMIQWIDKWNCQKAGQLREVG